MRAMACPIRRAGGGERGGAEAVAAGAVATEQPGDGNAIGVLHDVTLGILPDQDPRRRKTAA